MNLSRREALSSSKQQEEGNEKMMSDLQGNVRRREESKRILWFFPAGKRNLVQELRDHVRRRTSPQLIDPLPPESNVEATRRRNSESLFTVISRQDDKRGDNQKRNSVLLRCWMDSSGIGRVQIG